MFLLAELVFAHPALLFGACAAAVPILIHLLLRPRPQRTRFPAIGLLRPAFACGQRASRLRNLLLMLVRALLVVLAALLLAAPTCTPRVAEFIGTRPVACVVVLDDSGSMSYRPAGESTLLELACERAIAFVQSAAAWPADSAIAWLSAGTDEGQLDWTADRSTLVPALRNLGPDGRHARPLSGALRAAAELLRSAEQPAKRIVVFTDGAAHAWRDVTPAILAGLKDLAVRIVCPSDDVRSNIAILAAAGPVRLHPAGAPVPLRVTLAAEGVDSQCWLLVQQDGRTLQRHGPVSIAGHATREVVLELPRMSPGPHAVTLQLDPRDRMDFDQQRHVALQTGPRPIVWLLTLASSNPDADVSALILQNLLAPEILRPEQQLVELRTLPSERLAAALADAAPRHLPVLTVVLSGAGHPPKTTRGLLRHVAAGATVLLVPSSSGREPDWPGLRPLLSAIPPALEELAGLTALRWESGSPYATETELTRCAVRRRVRLTALNDGVVVEARYSDQAPAIVSRRVGSGRVLALTAAPDPQWGELGVRAAGLITWLHRLIDEAAGAPDAVATLALGAQTHHRFANLPAAGLVRVALQTHRGARPSWTRLRGGAPEKPWPTERAGIYSVNAAGGDQRTALYVVNWPPEESRLEPIRLPELRRRLGHEDVVVDAPGGAAHEAVPTLVGRIRALRDLTKPLAALLLAAFLLESLLAVRHFRRPPGAMLTLA